MAIDFPNAPATSATYTVGNKTWIYDGTTWNTYNSTTFSAETLPGTTIKSTVTGSSLTSVGTLGSLSVTGIATAGTFSGSGASLTSIPNSATTATSANTISTIVARDSSGNFTATNITATAITSGSYLQGTDYLSPYQGFRNKIINGSFEFWQRGTARTYLNAGSYLADRWTIRQYQNGSHQRTTVTPVTGMQTRYALKVGSSTTAENAGGTRMYADTALESGDSIPLRGKTVTLSFWIRFSSATATSSTATPYGNFTGTVNWNTSTTDAAMGTTGYDGGSSTTITNGSLPTTWTKYTVSGTISSSANNVGVEFGFAGLGSTAVADTVWYEVTQVQLEVGSVATPFEQRPMQTELALCQRYFQKSYQTTVTAGTVTDAGQYAFYGTSNMYVLMLGTIQLRVPMRVIPTTITYYRSDISNTVGWSYFNSAGGGGSGTPTTVYASETSFTPYLSIGSSSYASGGMIGHWIASAEL